MAVEKMAMMDMVIPIGITHEVLKKIILLGKVNLTNAIDQIEDSEFVLNVEGKNMDKIVNLSFISPYPTDNRLGKYSDKINAIKTAFHLDFSLDKNCLKTSYSFDETADIIDIAYEKILKLTEKKDDLEKELKKIDNLIGKFSYIHDMDISIDDLRNLNYFQYQFGVLSKENRIKLKKNYENISALAFHLGSGDKEEIYLMIYPKSVEDEIKRIFRSLNFSGIDVPKEFSGTPRKVIQELKNKKKVLLDNIKEIDEKLQEIEEKNIDSLKCAFSRFQMEKKIEEADKYLASSKKFAYLSAWVSVKDKQQIRDEFKEFENLLIEFKDEKEVQTVKPPTKLKNNRLFSPFESLVKMYGTPSYNELDPTPFLSVTYMFLFGAMFGDLGQGFIFLLAGIFLSKKKKNSVFGPLIMRIGASSMIFGTLYGGFFGFENVIPALLLRPFDNINLVLEAAVFIGIFLIFMSYGYSIINAVKVNDIENGVFGKNGIAGLIFYISLLLLIGGKFLNRVLIPTGFAVVLLLLTMAAMVVKQPLGNLIKKKPLYNESVSDYYIESGFSIIETLLSMLSGTLSFIRVGAFALTHVGLFIAFQTIGRLIGSGIGDVVVLIIGNVVIICLEGLIVFIQGLRLEYYELFSRYYKGEGVEFSPIKIN
jgi:V/A-type H+-transporting ATPase subunit I